MLQNRTDIPRGKFKTPYLNGKYVLPFLIVGALVIIFTNYKQDALDFITNKEELKSRDEIVQGLNPNEILFLKNHLLLNDGASFRRYQSNINDFYTAQGTERLVRDLKILKLPKSHFYRYGWRHFLDKIPTWIFILFTFFIAVMTHLKNLSTIPLLGLLSCLYMMSEIKAENWFFFFIWLVIGLGIYAAYGRKYSKLALKEKT